MASADQYDVLVATDCRFPAGNTASVVDEIRAQAKAGYRTGLLHLPSPLVGRHRSFAPALRRLLDDGTAELVSGTEVATKLLLVRHPSVFAEPPAERAKIQADRIVVVANAFPDGPRRFEQVYDVEQVTRRIEGVAGVAPTWAPISPLVRDALAPYANGVTLLPWDWESVIDLGEWHVERGGFTSDRPVLGRHTTDHWTKWPGRRRDLLAAYPDDPRYQVRVLGGTDTPTDILGYQPANWAGWPFGSVPAPRFLAGIDFFVYFHHRKFTEPFGRAVLEALAAGAVAIVPRSLEPIFGDACLYGEPSDVCRHVDELFRDWDAFAERSGAGVELVTKRFGYDAHLERLASLIGEPEEHAATAAPPPRQRGTLVVDLTRGDSLNPTVSSVVRATVAEGGPRIVALPAARTGDLTARVAVETFPRVLDRLPATDRRRYLQNRLADMVQAHAPARVLVVDDGHGRARDVFAHIDTTLTDVWLIQSGGTSDHGGDPVAAEVASILPAGWTIARLPESSAPPSGSAAPPGPASSELRARAQRRMGRWTSDMAAAIRRRMLAWLRADSQQAGLMLVELDGAESALPVSAGTGQHAPEQLPVALVVVADEYGDPADGVRAIVERQLVAGTFRTALLAPPDWEPAASAAGLTVETFISEPAWTLLYGAGWPEYVRRRVREACQAVAASTVVFSDRPIAGPDGSSVALDVLEAARVRPPAHPR